MDGGHAEEWIYSARTDVKFKIEKPVQFRPHPNLKGVNMKKSIVVLSFIYMTWNVCVDGGKDYTGKKEDKYGVVRSSVSLSESVIKENQKTKYIFSTNGEYLNCSERHKTFENATELKSFLRGMPPEVRGHPQTMEITGE